MSATDEVESATAADAPAADDDEESATASGASSTAGAAQATTFTADIYPILVGNCGRCHDSGSLPRFATPSETSSYGVAVRLQNQIVGEIVTGDMPADTCDGPPGTTGCLSKAELALIRQWVNAGSPE